MSEKIIDIAKVIKSSNLPASTLRYYEAKGLIQSAGRKGLRRQYDIEVLERLALISLARTAGFSLEEIADMLIDNNTEVDRQLLLNKADELDKTIKQLIAARDGLRHAAECSAPSHVECPTFQRLLKKTSKRRFKAEQSLKPKS